MHIVIDKEKLTSALSALSDIAGADHAVNLGGQWIDDESVCFQITDERRIAALEACVELRHAIETAKVLSA